MIEVYFNEIHKLDDTYEEYLVDETNFQKASYKKISPIERNINMIVYDDVYDIEPKSYYKIICELDITQSNGFAPDKRLIQLGLIVSDIYMEKDKYIFFVYNTTQNHVYFRPTGRMGVLYD